MKGAAVSRIDRDQSEFTGSRNRNAVQGCLRGSRNTVVITDPESKRRNSGITICGGVRETAVLNQSTRIHVEPEIPIGRRDDAQRSIGRIEIGVPDELADRSAGQVYGAHNLSSAGLRINSVNAFRATPRTVFRDSVEKMVGRTDINIGDTIAGEKTSDKLRAEQRPGSAAVEAE